MGIFSRLGLAALLLLAAPAQAALYAPGETLDPACAPLDADCGVSSVVGTGTQGQIPYYAANGGVLSATSSITILANGNVNVAGALAVGNATSTRTNLGLSYTDASQLSTRNIASWGDSLTFGTGGTSYASQLSLLISRKVYNGGVPGDTSTQIRTRMLADTSKHGWPTIIWAGRNNYTDPTTVKADIAAMVAALGHQNYIVLSILNGTSELSGSGNYISMMQLNSDLAAIYGSHYLDVRSYLVSQYDSGTAQDVIDHGNDIPPSSLRADGLHLNDAGYLKVAQFIQENISLLVAAPASTSVLTTETLGELFSSIGTLSSVDTLLGYKQGGTTILHASGLNNSTLVGITAGQNLGSAAKTNVAIGWQSMFTATSSVNNTAVGTQTLLSNTSGIVNTAIGHQSLAFNTTGSSNAGLGFQSLYSNTTGSNNTALGNIALKQNTTGIRNTALGYGALQTATTSNANTGIGFNSGFGITTGQNNILIGASTIALSYDQITTGTSNISIGYNVAVPSPTASGQLSIQNIIYGTGNTGTGSTISSGNIGIGTTSPWRKFSVTGTVGFDGLTGASGTGSLCLSANKEVVYNATSDSCLSSTRETKHSITSLALSELEMLQKLNPVSFVYNGDETERLRYGFIADEADAIDPHLATRDMEGKLSGLDTSAFIALIVGAVQELSDKVEGFANSFTTKDLNAQKLCLGSTCVTEAELQQFLNQSNQQSVTPTAPAAPAEPEPSVPAAPQEPAVPQPPEEPVTPEEPVLPSAEPISSEAAL